MTVACTYELLHLTAHGLVTLGGGGSQVMGTPVDITVEGTIIAVESLDDAQRLLCGGRIVEVNQRVAVDLGGEDGKLGAEIHIFYK